MPRKKPVGQRILDGLREFTENLEAGVPIEATRLRRVETPDGPMHLSERVVLNQERPPAAPEEGRRP